MRNEEIRARNTAVVEAYMALKGAARAERWKMFTDDATSGLQYSATGQPMIVQGIDSIRRSDAFNCKNFPDWGFTNIKLFFSEDPNEFLVECDGGGTSLLLGRPIRHQDHYIHKFTFRDGKICLYREFMNPCNELIEMGVKMPDPPVTSHDVTDG